MTAATEARRRSLLRVVRRYDGETLRLMDVTQVPPDSVSRISHHTIMHFGGPRIVEVLREQGEPLP